MEEERNSCSVSKIWYKFQSSNISCISFESLSNWSSGWKMSGIVLHPTEVVVVQESFPI
jgi:hypothetical protein